MKQSTLSFTLFFISTVLASDFDVSPGYFQLDLNKVKVSDGKITKVNEMQRRQVTVIVNGGESAGTSNADVQGTMVDGYFEDVLNNNQYFYSSNVKIGSPGQDMNLLVDTGSSDTWVFSPNTKGKPKSAPAYNYASSTTFKQNQTAMSIKYGIGSVKGVWATDKFQMSGAQLNSLSFGVATEVSGISQGLIGIGRKEAETTNQQGYTYNNLPWQLKQEGVIKKAAYSMYLDDLNQKSGTVLFGGIDSSKYMGTLVGLPISHPKHLGVSLQGLSFDGRDTSNAMSKPMTAILDSGTSLSYFPSDILTGIRVALNANPSFAINQRYYCDCNITKNLILNFGAQQIAIPAYNFLWPITTQTNSLTATFAFPSNSCYLSLEEAKSGQDYILLGDNVLHGMYIAYDLENEKIGLAKMRQTKGPSSIRAFDL